MAITHADTVIGMTGLIASGPPVDATPASSLASRGRLHHLEDAAISTALGAMVALPLVDMLLRRVAGSGLAGATQFVQHLGLIVGMVGGAIAAREGRLLALSTVAETLCRGRTRVAARVLSGAVGATVSVCLAVAGLDLVQVTRETGKTLTYGVPVWFVQLAMPIGFAAIAIRQAHHASDRWAGRAVTVVLTVLMAGAPWALPDASNRLFVPAVILLTGATLLGAPAFVALGGAALALFWWAGEPIAAIAVSHFSLVTNPSIPSLPLFTLAGYALAESGAPRRLIRVFDAIFGRVRGGPAIVTVLVCTFFTAFTGASGVTILALGGLLTPILAGAGYSRRDSLGLVTGAGSLGLLLPPCLPLIVYAIVARIPMEQLFLGGLLPALLMTAGVAWWGVARGPKRADPTDRFEWGSARDAVWDAKWELLTPVVAIAALFSGVATSVEAAALTAAYVLVIETFVHRDIHLLRDLPRVMKECGLLMGGVLLILGVALSFTNYLVDAEVPARAVEWTTRAIQSPLAFLLLLNAFLAIVGCLMDIYSAIVILAPLVVPLGAAYGISPVHLGIVFLANLELGYLTPPVGLNLFLASYRFGEPVPVILRAVAPVIAVLALGVLLITYVPALTTTLPRLLGGT